MMTNACMKRKGVFESSELGDLSTIFEVDESRLSKEDGVTSIPTCEHQLSSEVNAESMNTRKSQCTKILRKLMDHKGGWIFNQPVDPVLYGLPDYFDVIRNPMDLGTVKKKLTSKQYVSTDEFAADVRLTFSNAMKYNPPGNDIHAIAQELNGIFDSKWESAKATFTKACKKRRGVCVSSDTVFEAEESRLSKKDGVTSIPIKPCRNIIRTLIDYKGGWLFKDPVDPVLLGIPDYFDVIRNPMDLGTVNNKLTKKKYVSIEEFAADVRLTFSNAMKYNPPGNDVHAFAKELNGIFESEWESVERKFRSRNPVQEQQTMKVIKVRAIMDSKNTVARGPVACLNSKPLVPKAPIACSNSIAKKTLTDALSSKVKIKFSVRSSDRTSSKDIPLEAAGSKEVPLNHPVSTGKKEASLDRTLPFAKENAKISRIRETEHSSSSTGNESWTCNETTSPLASSLQGEESYLHDEPLSPSRALRAAILRSRFAGTIVKAQQKALLDQGKNIDPVKLQLEKERLEKKQQEEKARIEAQVKAAEAAAQRKFDEEMRMKREKEREAARLALRTMKKTVDIDNSDFLKELENFSETWQSTPPGKLIVDFIDGDLPPGLGSPLERLGLFMKNDFDDEVELEMEDSASPSMDVDMSKDFQEDARHEMQDSISPATPIGMKNDFKAAEGHDEMEDSLSPSTVIDTKKDSEEEREHEMVDSVSPSTVIDTKKDSEAEREHEMVDSTSPLMDVDTEEGEISC